jgi:hypothetical protein
MKYAIALFAPLLSITLSQYCAQIPQAQTLQLQGSGSQHTESQSKNALDTLVQTIDAQEAQAMPTEAGASTNASFNNAVTTEATLQPEYTSAQQTMTQGSSSSSSISSTLLPEIALERLPEQTSSYQTQPNISHLPESLLEGSSSSSMLPSSASSSTYTYDNYESTLGSNSLQPSYTPWSMSSLPPMATNPMMAYPSSSSSSSSSDPVDYSAITPTNAASTPSSSSEQQNFFTSNSGDMSTLMPARSRRKRRQQAIVSESEQEQPFSNQNQQGFQSLQPAYTPWSMSSLPPMSMNPMMAYPSSSSSSSSIDPVDSSTIAATNAASIPSSSSSSAPMSIASQIVHALYQSTGRKNRHSKKTTETILHIGRDKLNTLLNGSANADAKEDIINKFREAAALGTVNTEWQLDATTIARLCTLVGCTPPQPIESSSSSSSQQAQSGNHALAQADSNTTYPPQNLFTSTSSNTSFAVPAPRQPSRVSSLKRQRTTALGSQPRQPFSDQTQQLLQSTPTISANSLASLLGGSSSSLMLPPSASSSAYARDAHYGYGNTLRQAYTYSLPTSSSSSMTSSLRPTYMNPMMTPQRPSSSSSSSSSSSAQQVQKEREEEVRMSESLALNRAIAATYSQQQPLTSSSSTDISTSTSAAQQPSSSSSSSSSSSQQQMQAASVSIDYSELDRAIAADATAKEFFENMKKQFAAEPWLQKVFDRTAVNKAGFLQNSSMRKFWQEKIATNARAKAWFEEKQKQCTDQPWLQELFEQINNVTLIKLVTANIMDVDWELAWTELGLVLPRLPMELRTTVPSRWTCLQVQTWFKSLGEVLARYSEQAAAWTIDGSFLMGFEPDILSEWHITGLAAKKLHTEIEVLRRINFLWYTLVGQRESESQHPQPSIFPRPVHAFSSSSSSSSSLGMGMQTAHMQQRPLPQLVPLSASSSSSSSSSQDMGMGAAPSAAPALVAQALVTGPQIAATTANSASLNTENLDNPLLCQACLTNHRNIAFSPCGHIYACQTCAQRIIQTSNKCPICREPIRGWTRAILS